MLSGAAPVGVADLLRKGGLLYSERPAGLLRKPGRFSPKNAGNSEKDQIHGGSAFIDSHKYGGEIYNFLPDSKGIQYGFVASRGQIHISKHLGARHGADRVSDITVIWCAPKNHHFYIVGWYRNATVYKEPQPCPEHLVGQRTLPEGSDWTFCFVARQKDTRLLPEENRKFEIPRASSAPTGFGESCLWYADKDRALRQQVRRYIASMESKGNSATNKSGKGGRPRQPDITKRLLIENAAMQEVTSYYEKRGWTIIPVYKSNKGWDIEAKKNDSVLRIEAKGLSGKAIKIELTPQEYEQMKKQSLR